MDFLFVASLLLVMHLGSKFSFEGTLVKLRVSEHAGEPRSPAVSSNHSLGTCEQPSYDALFEVLRAMTERFERHRQPWRPDEIQKLRTLAAKGIALKAISKALTRSEESVKQRAKEDGLKIAKLR